MAQQQFQPQQQLTAYESCLDGCGLCGGFLRTWLPCICFCFPLPYTKIEQSTVGLVEKFGKYYKTIGSGLNYINPCTDQVITVDLKTVVIDLTRQTIITKDNDYWQSIISLFGNNLDPVQSTYRVQNLTHSVKEITYAALRQVCGEHILQELLEHKDRVAENIEGYLDKQTQNWGIFIDEVLIKDMIMTRELQSELASAAKNKRTAQAKVISAKADVESAKLMREAADILDSKAAMQIRFLESLQLIATGPCPKIMFLPIDPQSTADISY